MIFTGHVSPHTHKWVGFLLPSLSIIVIINRPFFFISPRIDPREDNRGNKKSNKVAAPAQRMPLQKVHMTLERKAFMHRLCLFIRFSRLHRLNATPTAATQLPRIHLFH